MRSALSAAGAICLVLLVLLVLMALVIASYLCRVDMGDPPNGLSNRLGEVKGGAAKSYAEVKSEFIKAEGPFTEAYVKKLGEGDVPRFKTFLGKIKKMIAGSSANWPRDDYIYNAKTPTTQYFPKVMSAQLMDVWQIRYLIQNVEQPDPGYQYVRPVLDQVEELYAEDKKKKWTPSDAMSGPGPAAAAAAGPTLGLSPKPVKSATVVAAAKSAAPIPSPGFGAKPRPAVVAPPPPAPVPPPAGAKTGPPAGAKTGPPAGAKTGPPAGAKPTPAAGAKTGPPAGVKTGPPAVAGLTSSRVKILPKAAAPVAAPIVSAKAAAPVAAPVAAPIVSAKAAAPAVPVIVPTSTTPSGVSSIVSSPGYSSSTASTTLSSVPTSSWTSSSATPTWVPTVTAKSIPVSGLYSATSSYKTPGASSTYKTPEGPSYSSMSKQVGPSYISTYKTPEGPLTLPYSATNHTVRAQQPTQSALWISDRSAPSSVPATRALQAVVVVASTHDAGVAKMSTLTDRGGERYIIVPDKSTLSSPDRLQRLQQAAAENLGIKMTSDTDHAVDPRGPAGIGQLWHVDHLGNSTLKDYINSEVYFGSRV